MCFSTPNFYICDQQAAHTHACLCASLVLMPVQMAETWPLLLLYRPGNKASSCTCKDQITCMNIQANVLETLIYKSRNGRTGGNTPGPLLDSELPIESYVMTDLLLDSFMAKS